MKNNSLKTKVKASVVLAIIAVTSLIMTVIAFAYTGSGRG